MYQMGSACSVKSIISSWNHFHKAIIYTCILVSLGVQGSSNDTKSMAVKIPDPLYKVQWLKSFLVTKTHKMSLKE